jgi:hypothetical protein
LCAGLFRCNLVSAKTTNPETQTSKNKSMLNESVIIRFEFTNNTAFGQLIKLSNVPAEVPPNSVLFTSLTASPGDLAHFTFQLKEVTSELKFEIHFSTDFVKFSPVYFEGWAITEIMINDKLYYECTYTTLDAVTNHKFKIPVKPPIGILIVGTTDPVIPQPAN